MPNEVLNSIGIFLTALSIGLITISIAGGPNAAGQEIEKPLSSRVNDSLPNTQSLTIPLATPAEALKKMELPPGFKATVFAAEPDVHQPISITTDSRGRLWVVECYTYSDGQENFNLGLNDRIVIFDDTNHDGIFDERKIFWDQGKKLTSVEVGFGGVWVTAAPNLMFIPDRNGDDVPDGDPVVLLDGFQDDVIRHNIVNGLRWGPDGWLYGRHGIQATSFVGPPGATESQRTALNCAIWRFHPTSHVFEIVAQGGTNSWGFDFNEHGEMFMINTVIGHLFHVVPGVRTVRMYGSHFNPHTYQMVEQTADHFHFDVGNEVWSDIRKKLSDRTDAAGGGHAHTGLMIYQGDNWPAEFRGKLLTANFHGRRINSDYIEREGNSYVAHHGSDYFKTADPWFRGIELMNGPDGGVYVLDWSDIGECHEQDGIHRTSGRIYKITYGDPNPPNMDDLSTLDTRELITQLAASNDWYARQARRILQERFSSFNPNVDENARVDLVMRLKDAYGATENEVVKLKIMRALDCCDVFDEAWLIAQTDHPSEYVRSGAIRSLTDGRFPISGNVCDRLRALATADESGLVRLYLASALPRLQSTDALDVASHLADHASDAEDRVQPKLIWYGIEPYVVAHPQQAIKLAMKSQIPLLRENIARRLTSEIESQPTAVDAIVSQLAHLTKNESESQNDEQKQQAADLLSGMALALEGWNQAPAPAAWAAVAKKLAAIGDPETTQRVQQLSLVFGDGRSIDDVKKIAVDTKADPSARRQAIASLAQFGNSTDVFETIKPLIYDRALAIEVVRALSVCDSPEIPQLIINRINDFDPVGKAAAINTLVVRETWALELLNAVEANQFPVSMITAAHARQINNFASQPLSQKLTEVWGQIRETSDDRLAQINHLRNVLADKLSTETSDEKQLAHGQQIFEKTCANCHTLNGLGGKIGPDLTGSDRKNLNYLLENIVDPSASVAESYRSSIVQLDDGRLFTGVVVLENDRTIQLQTAENLMTLDRRSIEEVKQTKSSLMPDGLLDALPEDDIAVLFEYLSK